MEAIRRLIEQARHGHLRRPARVHLLRREHQGQGSRRHPRRDLRPRRPWPRHHRQPGAARTPRRPAHIRASRPARRRAPSGAAVVAGRPRGRGAARPGAGLPGAGRTRAGGHGRDPLRRRRGHQRDHRAPPTRGTGRRSRRPSRSSTGCRVRCSSRCWPPRSLSPTTPSSASSGRSAAAGSSATLLPDRTPSGPAAPQRCIPLGGPVPLGLSVFTFATDKFLSALNALASENKVTCCPARPS